MKPLIAALLLLVGVGHPAIAGDGPKYQIELKGRDACATPNTRGQAVADGGSIDVRTPTDGALAMRMTGGTAAISYLACTSSASECFRLVQEFEITCSDPSVREVMLTLDSSLVGYVSSARKAGACMRLASASVTPITWDSSPLAVAHPPMCVAGGESRQCNQHLPPVVGPPMPLGRYLLVADFTLDATAGGVCNARAVADFSPEAKVPTEWVQTRDPFQNANKDGFGFFVTVIATAPGGAANPPPSPAQPTLDVPAPPPVGPPPPRARPLAGRRREAEAIRAAFGFGSPDAPTPSAEAGGAPRLPTWPAVRR